MLRGGLVTESNYSATDSAVVTSTLTSTSTVVKTAYPKRSVPAPNNAVTYGENRLSSACSCLITEAPPATTTESRSERTVSTSTALATLVLPGPQLYCGIRAWSSAANAVKQLVHAAPNLASCRALCLQRSDGCASYDFAGGTCYTHLLPVDGGIAVDRSSPWIWYDRDCPIS